MNRVGQFGRWLAGVMLVGGMLAGAQVPADSPQTASPGPRLTLSSPQLRSTADRINMPWLMPDKLPDFRLKIERPAWDALSVTGLESRVRGIEFQLPIPGFWIGYELPLADEEPRATFSIQRGF